MKNPDITKLEDDKNVLHKANAVIDDIYAKFGPKGYCYLKKSDGTKITKIQLYTALLKRDGDILKVLKDLDVENYIDLIKAIKADDTLMEVQSIYRDKLIKHAETVVYNSLSDDNPKIRLAAATFILRTIGKSQGWSESPMVQINNANTMTPEEAKAQILNIFGLEDKPKVIDVDQKE